jgi:hypothetical protein
LLFGNRTLKVSRIHAEDRLRPIGVDPLLWGGYEHMLVFVKTVQGCFRERCRGTEAGRCGGRRVLSVGREVLRIFLFNRVNRRGC